MLNEPAAKGLMGVGDYAAWVGAWVGVEKAAVNARAALAATGAAPATPPVAPGLEKIAQDFAAPEPTQEPG
jgi:hypothetical protein